MQYCSVGDRNEFSLCSALLSSIDGIFSAFKTVEYNMQNSSFYKSCSITFN